MSHWTHKTRSLISLIKSREANEAPSRYNPRDACSFSAEYRNKEILSIRNVIHRAKREVITALLLRIQFFYNVILLIMFDCCRFFKRTLCLHRQRWNIKVLIKLIIYLATKGKMCGTKLCLLFTSYVFQPELAIFRWRQLIFLYAVNIFIFVH